MMTGRCSPTPTREGPGIIIALARAAGDDAIADPRTGAGADTGANAGEPPTASADAKLPNIHTLGGNI